MTLVVKDGNLAPQSISTQLSIANELVLAHVPSSVVSGVAQPASTTFPLPTMNTAPAAAVDGSGTVANSAAAQTLFGGVVPVNGFMFANNCTSGTIYVNDAGTAAANVGFPVAPGAIFITPSGYKPAGPVSIFGGATSGNFAARRW